MSESTIPLVIQRHVEGTRGSKKDECIYCGKERPDESEVCRQGTLEVAGRAIDLFIKHQEVRYILSRLAPAERQQVADFFSSGGIL